MFQIEDLLIDREDDYISVAQYIYNESGTRNTITKLINIAVLKNFEPLCYRIIKRKRIHLTGYFTKKKRIHLTGYFTKKHEAKNQG